MAMQQHLELGTFQNFMIFFSRQSKIAPPTNLSCPLQLMTRTRFWAQICLYVFKKHHIQKFLALQKKMFLDKNSNFSIYFIWTYLIGNSCTVLQRFFYRFQIFVSNTYRLHCLLMIEIHF